PKLLAHYHEHQPGVRLNLHEDWSARQIELLLEEKLDLALLRRPTAINDPKLAFTLIEREPLWLAMPPKHRLAGKRTITPSELHGETLVGYSTSAAQYFHEVLATVLAHYGITPHIEHHSA